MNSNTAQVSASTVSTSAVSTALRGLVDALPLVIFARAIGQAIESSGRISSVDGACHTA